MITKLKSLDQTFLPPVFSEISIFVEDNRLIVYTTVCINKDDDVYAIISKAIGNVNKIDYVDISKFFDSLVPDINKLRKNYSYKDCRNSMANYYQLIK